MANNLSKIMYHRIILYEYFSLAKQTLNAAFPRDTSRSPCFSTTPPPPAMETLPSPRTESSTDSWLPFASPSSSRPSPLAVLPVPFPPTDSSSSRKLSPPAPATFTLGSFFSTVLRRTHMKHKHNKLYVLYAHVCMR